MPSEAFVCGATTQHFGDPDHFQSAIVGCSGMYTVLGRGEFHADLASIRVGRLLLQRGQETLPKLSSTALPQNRVGILGWLHDGKLPIVRGIQMQPGEFFCLGSGMESHHRVSGANDFALLTLDPVNLASAASDLTGRELVVSGGQVIRPHGHVGAWLLSVMDAATRASLATPGIFSSPAASKALEQALLGPMIGCFLDSDIRRDSVPRSHRAAMAKRFEAAVEGHLDRPLLISDLCRMLNITARSLNILCQEQIGMSAQQFLARRRLKSQRGISRYNSRQPRLAIVPDISVALSDPAALPVAADRP